MGETKIRAYVKRQLTRPDTLSSPVLDSSGHPTGLSQAPDLQSAAKVSLLCAKSDNVTKAFEFSLQSIVRQSDSEVPLTKKSSQVFRAYSFYLHCSARGGTSSRAEKQSLVRRQLTERLVTCWQDLKFSFLHLEKLIVKEKDPVIFQVLVLTLFCPQSASSPDGTPESSSSTTIKLGSNKAEDDIIEAPVGGLGHDRDDGPRLVDLFTPGMAQQCNLCILSNNVKDIGRAKRQKSETIFFNLFGNQEQSLLTVALFHHCKFLISAASRQPVL